VALTGFSDGPASDTKMDAGGESRVAFLHARRVRNMKDITLGVKQLRVGACDGEGAQGQWWNIGVRMRCFFWDVL
jgi:hypothetical protein